MRPTFRPKQSLGQNFLTDPNTIRKIADTLQAEPDDAVVEIGAGTGALTQELSSRYSRLIALEVDQRAVKQLRRELEGVDIHEKDVLEVDWKALADEHGKPLFVIGNLPYNITSPILFDLLAAREVLAEAVLMVQREVADRFVAKPGSKTYGIPSVLVQSWSDVNYEFGVSPHVFYPQPDVSSAIVRLTFDAENEPKDLDDEWLRTVVRTAFGKRRKMLRNSLRQWTKDVDLPVPNEWGTRRPESLSPEEFATLARELKRQLAAARSSETG